MTIISDFTCSKKARILFFGLFALLTCVSVQAKPPSLIFDAQGPNHLSSHVEYWQDLTADSPIEHVTSLDPKQWLSDNKTLNFGFTTTPYWLRWQINNPKDTPLNVYIEFEDPRLNQLDLYHISSKTKHQQIGNQYPFNDRIIKTRTLVFPVTLAPGANTFYVRGASADSLQLPLTAWLPDQFYLHSQLETNTYSIMFGLMIMMMLYSPLFFISMRDKTFIYYTGFSFSLLFFFLSFHGMGYQYLWPNQVFFNLKSVALSGCFGLIFSCLFSASFLQIKKHAPSHLKVLKTIIGCSILGACLLPFVPYEIIVKWLIALTIICYTSIWICAISVFRQGNYYARFFLMGWSVFILGSVVLSLNKAGWLPRTPFTEYLQVIGTVIEVLPLSLALSDRINRSQKDKDIAQRQALYLSEEASNAKASALAFQEQTNQELENKNTKLKYALQEVERSNRLKEEFLATISHELRTPMNGVRGSLELIETEPMSGNANKYLKTACDSAHGMMRLINGILEFSEVQAGNLPIQNEPFKPNQIFECLEKEYKPQCERNDLSFRPFISKDTPELVMGDVRKIGQILSHLLDNAIKFTEQGTVHISVEPTFLSNNKCLLTFVVSDTGSGIPKEKQQDIFNAFQQADGSFSRKHDGLGIGLAICHQLAVILNGKLYCTSELGKGSHFSFEIPLTVTENQPSLAVKNKQTSTLNQKHVLVVEDNHVNQMVISNMLKKLGYLVTMADEGWQACEMLSQLEFDIVLMDCQMPVMDGFEATRRIRQQSLSPDVPIVAVTANVMTGDRQRCIDAGMNDYLKKPVRLKQLEDTLEKWI